MNFQLPSRASKTRVSRTVFTTSLVAAAVTIAVGCSSNPSATDTWNQFMNAYCSRLQACFPDTGSSDAGDPDAGTGGAGAFSTAFPNGVSQCVTANPAPASANGKVSACSQAQVNTCLNDMKTVNCVGLVLGGAPALPTSCNSC